MQDSLNKKKLVLVGGGGHCESVLDSVLNRMDYGDIVITDPQITKGSSIHGVKVIGNDEMLPFLLKKGYRVAFITLGSITDTSKRRQLAKNVQSLGFEFPSIVDPSAVVANDVALSDGVFVGKRAIINSSSNVGKLSIINTGAIIEHGCRVGAFSHISVGAVVCGECVVGNDVLIGANSTIIQGIKIGDNSIIGAGSIVLSDVPDNTTVTGIWKGGLKK